MQPSWSIPTPQAMQQHGGSAKSQVTEFQAAAPAPMQAGAAPESGVRACESVAAPTNEAGPGR
jgi:hypothetical protein